jgi:hypothetical protein
MVRLSSPGPAARAAAILAILATTACTDGSPLEPEAAIVAPTDAQPQETFGLFPWLHVAGRKYRDTGLLYATGRAGRSEASALAVRGKTGLTWLIVSTGDPLSFEWGQGSLVKVEVKVHAPDGTFQYRTDRSYTMGGTTLFFLPGIAPGSILKIKAHVKRSNGRTVDVVTLEERVKQAPALEADINVPAVIVPNTPTVITATVRETAGHIGGWTDCVLYVDGRKVDEARSVWVDAGDQVTCAFTHTFTAQGQHRVEVRLFRGSRFTSCMDLGPVVTDVVTVVSPQVAPTFAASVDDRTSTITTRYDYHWSMPNGSHKEYESTVVDGSHTQSLSLTGSLARATVFPLAVVELDISSTAGPWQSSAFSGLTSVLDGLGRACVDQPIPDNGGHFFTCSTGSGATGSTTFSYTRFAGTVTYHSYGFSRTWDAIAAQEAYWTWNDAYETHSSGGQIKPLGTAVNVRLHVRDGLSPYTITTSIPLVQYDSVVGGTPTECVDEQPYWLEGGTQTICQSRAERVTGWRGQRAG